MVADNVSTIPVTMGTVISALDSALLVIDMIAAQAQNGTLSADAVATAIGSSDAAMRVKLGSQSTADKIQAAIDIRTEMYRITE